MSLGGRSPIECRRSLDLMPWIQYNILSAPPLAQFCAETNIVSVPLIRSPCQLEANEHYQAEASQGLEGGSVAMIFPIPAFTASIGIIPSNRNTVPRLSKCSTSGAVAE